MAAVLSGGTRSSSEESQRQWQQYSYGGGVAFSGLIHSSSEESIAAGSSMASLL